MDIVFLGAALLLLLAGVGMVLGCDQLSGGRP
jgi:hypothetical protein